MANVFEQQWQDWLAQAPTARGWLRAAFYWLEGRERGEAWQELQRMARAMSPPDEAS